MPEARGYFELTRLHKPLMGNTLMFWPCAWGLTIAARATSLPLVIFVEKLVWFALGSMLLHSAACVLNDICDVEFDRQVERTKERPLPSGRVSMHGAVTLCVVLLAPALYILSHCDRLGIAMGIIGVFPLHAFYPLMKRWTWWPQAWLGLAFNWGIPVAWISVTGTLPPPAIWVLFTGGVCWTIVYDTIYACQDREDDKRVGIKSTALLFGEHVRSILAIMVAILLACLMYAGFALGQGIGYATLSCGGTLLHTAWQIATWNEADLKDHRAKFESNGLLGVVIWLGTLYDYLHVLYPTIM
ncbi:UbiA prenyltransferase [Lentinus tigrinus ALCF2SS1-7]|uniref:4-hydroxybenzoate polyprenyltransferase, mitochondrial n=1 Tax=Lentinus tigrinus ALCF2SS1-6 TaxID=1328759 RepID=A0A5C2RNI1_9APHY|nr:UbiA prenyltransferase [Lentinus tigrinus ALCF2SS1-6]RPD75371.1 UbiA prenyltransferase [Lentinus tigrinus ALCF2SS1-7]